MQKDCVRIRVLVENQALQGLEAEHGLSYLIEADGKKGLFDTGDTDMAIRNAETLGEDIKNLDWIALSHGHYDHTGGLKPVLSVQKKRVILFAHPAAFIEKYRVKNGDYKSIGIRMTRKEISEFADIVETKQPTVISERLTLTGEIPRVVPYETPFSGFVKSNNGVDDIDPISDDMSLIIKSPDGISVLFGCGHAGPVNTLQCVKSITNASSFRLVAGGMHLLNSDEDRIRRTVDAFNELGVLRASPVHCSGEPAEQAFKTAYGDKSSRFSAGVEEVL